LVAGLGSASGAEPAVASLDPLVVTEVRGSGQVLTGKELELFQADSVSRLAGLVPGLNVATSDTRGFGDIISMRGAANTLFFSSPTVGMMVDDVPMGDVFGYPSALMDTARIQVHRGPQGAAFGRNSPAGMIEIQTPRPGDELAARLTGEYGSYEAWAARLSSAGPLADGLSHTFQFHHDQRDGFIDNTTLGRATDDRSLTGGLANLFWKPSPDTEWRLRVLAERADDGSQRLSLLGSPDPFEVESEIPGKSVIDRHQISLHWTREGPWGRLKSISAWQDWSLDPGITDLDLLNSPPGFESRSTIYQDQTLWSQEFRWESPEDAGPWSWRTGAFFMHQSTGGDATRDFPVQVAPGVWAPFSEQTLFDLTEWNMAAYGRVFHAINERLRLSAGARLEYVDSEIDRSKTDSFFNTSTVREGDSAFYVSPEVGVEMALDDATRVFARSSIGNRPAGYSAFASNPVSAAYDNETTWSNELGIGHSIPDQRLDFTLTGYWNQTRDYQLNQPDIASTDYFTINAGRVTSIGVEGELRWNPMDALLVRASAGTLHARFDSAPRDGNPVPYIPEFNAALGVRYDLPHGFHVQSALRMTGEVFFEDTGDRRFRQGSYLCWDAEIGYATGPFSLAVFGRNLLDETYYTFINPQISAGSPGDPRMFGVRATMEF
jgi:iron complex outermembrane receptor protein